MQCDAAAKAANRTLGMINRTFVNRHRPTEILLKLYLSLVRPKLEYCIACIVLPGDLIVRRILIC